MLKPRGSLVRHFVMVKSHNVTNLKILIDFGVFFMDRFLKFFVKIVILFHWVYCKIDMNF